jgi:hypothetical protein
MDIQQFKDHVDKQFDDIGRRFDKLEEKLDEYAKQTGENTNDIVWMKGFAKVSLTTYIAIVGYFLAKYFSI